MKPATGAQRGETRVCRGRLMVVVVMVVKKKKNNITHLTFRSVACIRSGKWSPSVKADCIPLVQHYFPSHYQLGS